MEILLTQKVCNESSHKYLILCLVVVLFVGFGQNRTPWPIGNFSNT